MKASFEARLTCAWSTEDKDDGDLFRVKRGRTRGGRSRDGGHGGRRASSRAGQTRVKGGVYKVVISREYRRVCVECMCVNKRGKREQGNMSEVGEAMRATTPTTATGERRN